MSALLLSQLERAKNGLEDAQIALCSAARLTLKPSGGSSAETLKLCEGVKSRNERERAARLRLELATEYTAMAEAEDALTEDSCSLNVAGLVWGYSRACMGG